MKKILLMTGILILGAVLMLSGCGGTFGNSMTKVLVESEACAVEFPNPNNVTWNFVSLGSEHAELLGLPVTIEAWVKSNGTGGTVLARGDGANLSGLALFIDGAGLANFMAREDTVLAVTVPATSTTVVNDGAWHHLAGVLSNDMHPGHPDTTATGGTCDAAAMLGIHVDIYVDGVWEECAPAALPVNIDICYDAVSDLFLNCNNDVGRDITAIRDGGAAGLFLGGMVDEVRIWKEARSAGQISKWMDQQIKGTDWDTADPNNAIAGYWKFNECTGSEAIDSSGYGNTGVIQKCVDDLAQCNQAGEHFGPWYDAHVVGVQF